MDERPEPDLTSWKEIADRLQVTVRTAQEWEKKRGLPVRRLPGGRGRVFLRVRELEEWLDSDGHAGPAPHEQRRTVSLGALAAAVLFAVAAGALGMVAYGLYSEPPYSERQARLAEQEAPQWRVTPHELIVTGQDGRELWRAEFEQPLNPATFDRPGYEPRFVDVDGDGGQEMLFPTWPGDFNQTAPLICYDAQGRELWRYTVDDEIASADEPFENIYRVTAFAPVTLTSGEMGVVVVSVHYLYYPTQIALLSATDGSVMASYWHSGHVGHTPDTLLVADQNGDGRSEIFAAGTSNSYDRATLIVLDLETMKGASIEDDHPGYQLLGFDPPNEIARILFPRSSMNVRLSDRYNSGRHVWLTPEFINVQVLETINDPGLPSLFYHLAPDFTLDHMATSSTFEGVHARLLREGILTLSLEDELASLGPLEYVGTPRSLAASR